MRSKMTTGNCLCNKIRFEFGARPTDVSICHCSICQHTTGSAFGAYVKVSDVDLTLTGGADHLSSYKVTDNLTTQFCQICGSTVFATHKDYPGFVYVSLGLIAEGSDIRPSYHEFVGSKVGWFEIQDSLPRFEEWSDSE